MERDLPRRVAHLGPKVLAVEHLESLPGQAAEPEEEGDLRGRGEFARPPGEVDEGLLEDVGGVKPALEAAVQAEADHPLEPLPVAVPEVTEVVLIPACRLPKQRDRVVRVFHHGSAHTLDTAKVRRPSTVILEFSSD